jgi:hypothetical protein
MTFQINVRGNDVLYRCSLYGSETRTHWASFSVSTADRQKLFRDVEALGALDWDARFINPMVLHGEGWMLAVDFDGRQIEIIGSNAQPKDFPSLVDRISRFLERYPFGFSGGVAVSDSAQDCRTASIPLRNGLVVYPTPEPFIATPQPLPPEKLRR